MWNRHTSVVQETRNYMTTADDPPTREQELRAVEATLQRLQLTPEEAIKIVSKHLADERNADAHLGTVGGE
jgi:hypothetical protein